MRVAAETSYHIWGNIKRLCALFFYTKRTRVDLFSQDSLLNRSISNRNTGPTRSAGMSYPQFVEVLVLLAVSAARRLRTLYPDVAGEPAPSPTKRPPRNSDHLADSSGNTTTSRNGRSPFEGESAGVERCVDVGGDGKETTSNPAGQLIHRKGIDVHAAIRFKNGRCRESAPVVWFRLRLRCSMRFLNVIDKGDIS